MMSVVLPVGLALLVGVYVYSVKMVTVAVREIERRNLHCRSVMMTYFFRSSHM